MTTKDILNQMEKEFDEKFWHEEALETHQPCEYLLNNEDGKCNCQIKDIKKFIRSYTRTLLEGFGEEMINEKYTCNWNHDKEGVERDMCEECCAVSDFKIEQRLKMKEIIEGVGK